MRKLFFSALIAALLCGFRPAYCEDYQRVFTLEDSISTAMLNSNDVLNLKEQVLSSKQTINEAKGQIFPKIDVNVSASRFDNDIPGVLPQSFSSIYLPAGKEDIYYFSRLSLWQYLYAGGRYTTNLRLAETRYSEIQSQYEAMKNLIELEVKRAYYAVLLAKEKIRIYQKAVTGTEKAKSAGSGTKLRNELAKAKHEHDKVMLKFISAIGIELDTIIEVSGEMKVQEGSYEIEKCLACAYQYRPELKQTQFQEAMDGLRVNLSLIERYPTITLGANYDMVGENTSLDQRSWNATINMNIPVFDGWTSRARYKQRKNQARQGQLRRAQIEDQIRFEVRDAYIDYNFCKGRMEELNSKGVSSSPEDEIERINTVYEFLLSQAYLDWATGKSLR